MSQNDGNPENDLHKEPGANPMDSGVNEEHPLPDPGDSPALEERGLPEDDPERQGRMANPPAFEPLNTGDDLAEGQAGQPGAAYDEALDAGASGGEQENPSGSTMVEPGDTPPNDAGVNPEDPYRVEPYHDDEEPYRYDYYEDGYARPEESTEVSPPAASPSSTELATTAAAGAVVAAGGGGKKPPKEEEEAEEDDPEEEGMLRMSFMQHLEELRTRLIRIVAGLGIAFVVSILYAERLWQIVSEPATKALTELGIDPPNLTQITPMEAFNVVYIKLPLIASLFLASPWILYQVWGFIAPGLYKKERRWAAPFVIGSAGLFITGGLFAYFIAFRFGLTFLLGIGRDINITPMVSITEYFDLFMNVVLAIAVVFELPVLIFFLTLLRIVTPGFLIRNSRYAILGIVVLAAIITPTPDVFNLMIFSVPMIVLFFVGVLLSYVLVLHQGGKRFPWKVFWWTFAGAMLIIAGILSVAIFSYGYRFQATWPYLAP